MRIFPLYFSLLVTVKTYCFYVCSKMLITAELDLIPYLYLIEF